MPHTSAPAASTSARAPPANMRLRRRSGLDLRLHEFAARRNGALFGHKLYLSKRPGTAG